MSLLTLIQRAAGQLGLPQPATVIGNTDSATTQMYQLALQDGYETVDSYAWAQLQKLFQITIFATATTGTWTTAAATISSIPSTSTLAVGFGVSGTGFTKNASIIEINSSTQVTVSETPTAAGTAATVTFGQQAYPIPGDFSRYIYRTQWDRNFKWELMGPTSPQEWQWVKSGIIATLPRRRFRMMGPGTNQIMIDPVPGSTDNGQILVSEYYSDNFCVPIQWVTSTVYAANAKVSYSGQWYQTTAGGTSGATPPTHLAGSLSDGAVTWTYKGNNTYGPSATGGLPGWVADTDIAVIPEHILILGVKWRYRQAKGLEWQSFRDMWKSACDREAAKLISAKTLDLTKRRYQIFLSPANVPDTGYGS